MKPPITEEKIDQVYAQLSEMPEDLIGDLVSRLEREQPALLGYLAAVDETEFETNEQESILFLGVLLWQIFKSSSYQIRKISERKIEQCIDLTYNMIETYSVEDELDFESYLPALMENYPQPTVLRMLVEEAFGEAEEGEEPEFRDEAALGAFLHLKIALDAIIANLEEVKR